MMEADPTSAREEYVLCGACPYIGIEYKPALSMFSNKEPQFVHGFGVATSSCHHLRCNFSKCCDLQG